MELNLPPTQTPSPPETPTPGYQDASQVGATLTSPTPPPQPAPTTPVAETVLATPPLIPVKRRRMHMGRLFILLVALAAIGTGFFYAGRYLYTTFSPEPTSTSTTTQNTGPFTYTGIISNQPFLFSYPRDWKVTQTATGFSVTRTEQAFKSEGKEVPAYSVEILPLSRPLSSEQLAKAYIATSFKVIISQSATSIGLAIPSYVVVTTHESLTFSTLRKGTLYMVVTQPVLDTAEERATAKEAAQLFMSSIRVEE